MAQTIKFTKANIEKLPRCAPAGKRLYFRDEKTSHLQLAVSSGGCKSFLLLRRINGRPRWITLGRFPEMPIEMARKKASQLLAEIYEGKNPADQKQTKNKELTFGALFNEFMERHSKPNKKSWKYDESEGQRHLSHWFTRRISDISAADVKALHDKIRSVNGLYQANRTLERVRVIYNKANEWGIDCPNPARGVKKFKEKSRDRFLSKEELGRFFAALEKERELLRDFFTLLLFTGARKRNMLEMRWQDIDLEGKTWRIPETKNGEPLWLPLVPQVVEILHRRKENRKEGELHVFPSTSYSGHLEDPKKGWERVIKRAQLENLRIHDLRRTFASWQAIKGTSMEVIGKTLGHKSQQATAVYARLDLEAVEAAASKAVNAILEAAPSTKKTSNG